jgi:uncharacterized SAM-binding protein YcdF (DUF218 family)
MSMRRRRWLWALAVVVVALIVLGWNAGKWLVADEPEPSDVIVVLAGETDYRPQRALQLLDQGMAHRMLIDVPARSVIFNISEVELAQKYARGLPEAASVEICPIQGLSTRDESHDAEKCLAAVGGNRVLLVTSEFHTRRALSIFRHEIRGKSFSVAAAYNDKQFGTRWWEHREWSKTCFDEWLRLLWWNGIERWE